MRPESPERKKSGFDKKDLPQTLEELNKMFKSPEGLLAKFKSMFEGTFLGKIFDFLSKNPETANLAHHKVEKNPDKIHNTPQQDFEKINDGKPVMTDGFETLYLKETGKNSGPTTIHFHGSTRGIAPNYDQFSNALMENTDKITGAFVAPRCGKGARPLAGRFDTFIGEALNNLTQSGHQTEKVNLSCHSFGFQVLLEYFDKVSSSISNPPDLYISDPVFHKKDAAKVAELIESGRVGKVYIRYGAISAEQQAGTQELIQLLGPENNDEPGSGNYINRKLGISIMEVEEGINHNTAKRYLGKMMEGYA